jgi:hypothetical protein
MKNKQTNTDNQHQKSRIKKKIQDLDIFRFIKFSTYHSSVRRYYQHNRPHHRTPISGGYIALRHSGTGQGHS